MPKTRRAAGVALLSALTILPYSGVGEAQTHAASGPEIVARQTRVMTRPPAHVPSGTVVDGPILGNGDLGVAMGGPPALASCREITETDLLQSLGLWPREHFR